MNIELLKLIMQMFGLAVVRRLFHAGRRDILPRRLTITHNFRALREQPKGQVGENKKGAADNTL